MSIGFSAHHASHKNSFRCFIRLAQKAHWLCVALDGAVEDEKIKFLVDMSYELTKKEEAIASSFLLI